MSFNKVIVVGRLTRDPQVRQVGTQTVADLGVAVNRVWYDKDKQKKEETTFVDITAWGRDAEVAGEYLSKGEEVLVEGRLKTDSWEDKESGQKRYKMVVVCERLQLLGGKKVESPYENRDEEVANAEKVVKEQKDAAKKPKAKPAAPAYDDDVPF